jgi:putative DNA primase/helicase
MIAAPNVSMAAAHAYVAGGLSVLPVRADGSKAPALPAWTEYQKRLPVEQELHRWFDDGRLGIGVVAGKVSGHLEHLDFDADSDVVFPAWVELVEAEAPGLVDRLSTRTTPRTPAGYHVSYRCPEVEIPGNSKLAGRPNPDEPGKVLCLVETRGEGGYVLVPGSPAACHPSGGCYAHHRGPKLSVVGDITAAERAILLRCARSFDKMPAAEPQVAGGGAGGRVGDDFNGRGPDWSEILKDWTEVRKTGECRYWRRPGKDVGWSATTGHCRGKDGADLLHVFTTNASPFEDGQNYGKFRAYALLHHGGDYKAAARELRRQGYGQPANGRARPGAARAAGQGPAPGPDKPPVNLTDLGNARRVVLDHGQDLRYCHPWKSWLVWDGTRWRPDEAAGANRRMKQTQADLYRETAAKIRHLAGLPEGDQRKDEMAEQTALLKHLLRWEDDKHLSGCLNQMRSEDGIPVLPADLDRDPFLFNVRNGTLDLRTGQLRGHDRDDLITKLAPVEYDPGARWPLWGSFLARVMDNNGDLMEYLRRVVGYSLTGDVSEQAMWFLYGMGQNGKSTFLQTLLALFGDYGLQAVSELLMAKTHEQHPTERKDLFGRRFCATIETEQGKRMAEALMKQLTGGDPIRARGMKENFFQFDPTHKIFLAANHKPAVRGTDLALWRRIKLIPFTVTIPEQNKDKHLLKKLKRELPGILRWAVEGCHDWLKGGLREPAEVTKATNDYKAEEDTLAGFLQDCCFLHPTAKAKSSDLLDAYQRWTGDKAITSVVLGRQLENKGYHKEKGGDGCMYWKGIGLPSKEKT